MTQKEKLPHWDLTPLFPGLDSPEFQEELRAVLEEIQDLQGVLEREKIGRNDPPLSVGPEEVRRFEALLPRFNRLLERYHVLSAYLGGILATDSRNQTAHVRWSELQQGGAVLTVLMTRFIAWVGTLDVEKLIEASPLARDHAYALRRAQVEARHMMSPEQEELAAELNLTGGLAWSKLYGTYTSQILVPVETQEGKVEELPMSVVRGMATDPDREKRRLAYEAELKAWEKAAVPIAAALNSVKGQFLTLSRRRGWASPLDLALFENRIDRKTFDAMMEAAQDAFPHFRRYLKAKAKALGLPALAWYDLFAPVGKSRPWSFEEARAFIVEHFGRFSDRLQKFADRAFQERWIDAEPRPGKRDGGFCMWVGGDASRILVNYRPSFNSVRTLAHELGHAYHNLNLAGRTVIQRETPMTLAETASIFCETIIKEAALKDADPEERLMILEGSLQQATQVVVDITSRFLFESWTFERRAKRELSIEELKTLMLQAQRQTYGDGLDPERLHPYMWAAKPHYYSPGFAFYNFPYMFGLLFGLGLYARYQEDPEGFKKRYDELLSLTGMADAADLARQFGLNIRDRSFWEESLRVIRQDIDAFVSLVEQRS